MKMYDDAFHFFAEEERECYFGLENGGLRVDDVAQTTEVCGLDPVYR